MLIDYLDSPTGVLILNNDKTTYMASINQLISEIAHSIGQPNNFALRSNIRSIIIHERNERIRRNYENNSYTDRIFLQRFVVELISVNDGDIKLLPDTLLDSDVNKIKRTKAIVPRPVRLTNNLPFNKVSTVGAARNIVLPLVSESSVRFRNEVPGFGGIPAYDYINEHIYIFPVGTSLVDNLDKVCIEAAFEAPLEVKALVDPDGSESYLFDADDDEYFLPEDMVGTIKDIIYKRDLLGNQRNNNEVDRTL